MITITRSISFNCRQVRKKLQKIFDKSVMHDNSSAFLTQQIHLRILCVRCASEGFSGVKMRLPRTVQHRLVRKKNSTLTAISFYLRPYSCQRFLEWPGFLSLPAHVVISVPRPFPPFLLCPVSSNLSYFLQSFMSLSFLFRGPKDEAFSRSCH